MADLTPDYYNSLYESPTDGTIVGSPKFYDPHDPSNTQWGNDYSGMALTGNGSSGATGAGWIPGWSLPETGGWTFAVMVTDQRHPDVESDTNSYETVISINPSGYSNRGEQNIERRTYAAYYPYLNTNGTRQNLYNTGEWVTTVYGSDLIVVKQEPGQPFEIFMDGRKATGSTMTPSIMNGVDILLGGRLDRTYSGRNTVAFFGAWDSALSETECIGISGGSITYTDDLWNHRVPDFRPWDEYTGVPSGGQINGYIYNGAQTYYARGFNDGSHAGWTTGSGVTQNHPSNFYNRESTYFDGTTNAYLYAPDYSSRGAGAFSIQIWFKGNGMTAGGCLYSDVTSYDETNLALYLTLEPSLNRFAARLYFKNGNGTNKATRVDLTELGDYDVNEWNLYTVKWDAQATSPVKVFVNDMVQTQDVYDNETITTARTGYAPSFGNIKNTPRSVPIKGWLGMSFFTKGLAVPDEILTDQYNMPSCTFGGVDVPADKMIKYDQNLYIVRDLEIP